MALTLVTTELLSMAPFYVVEYIHSYGTYFDSCRFFFPQINGQIRFVHDLRDGINFATAVAEWMKRSARWGGGGSLLRLDSLINFTDLPFFRYLEHLAHPAWIAAIMPRYSNFYFEEFATHNFDYSALQQQIDQHFVLNNLDSGWKTCSWNVYYAWNQQLFFVNLQWMQTFRCSTCLVL